MSTFEDAEIQEVHPPWYEWCEKNSQPKNFYFPRIKRELTRWQKRGPMSRRDWVRFYHWASKNAMPREAAVEKEPECDEKCQKLKKKKKKTLDELLERVNELCEPRWPRDKYEYPPKPVYPYSPKIHYKEPAHKDRGRPFAPPRVPKWFQHIDLESEFWTTLRFPVYKPALSYKPSANVLKLAEPKIVPPLHRHCPIPEKPIEEIPPRRRMNRRQWLAHLRRLEYLAKPVLRPIMFDYSC